MPLPALGLKSPGGSKSWPTCSFQPSLHMLVLALGL
jgi:hypothetical protein